jgi:acetoin utilization protein AcuB
MIAEHILSNDIPPLMTSDSGLKAVAWMEEFRVNHLPIVNNRQFLGMISEDDIFELNSPEDALGNHELSLSNLHVKSYQHVFDVLRVMTDHKLTLISVVDKAGEYLGCITRKEVLESIAKISSVKDPGAIVILEMYQRDYSLAKIAQIVESEDGKILNVYINTHENDPLLMDLTLKINRSDLSAIKSALLRFDFNIKALYHESQFDDELKDRFDELMNYINM